MRVTTKGQVTIPRDVRESLGITAEAEIAFVEENGRFYIVKTSEPEPKGKFRKMRGIISSQMTTDEILSHTREA